MISTLSWVAQMFAQTAPSAAPAQDMRPLIFMLGAIGVLFWFVVLRPQRTEQKKRDEMLNEVAKGDHIVTTGGIHGTVEGVDLSKNLVSVSIAPKTTIRINKSSVASVTPKKKGGKGGEAEDSKGSKKA